MVRHGAAVLAPEEAERFLAEATDPKSGHLRLNVIGRSAAAIARAVGLRPISAAGEVNLAPYSFFNGVSSRPPAVVFSSEGWKHTVANVAETGEFVCNLATWELREAVNLTSAGFPEGVDEMAEAGLDAAPCRLVRPPRVAAAPCALECRLLRIVTLEDLEGNDLDRHLVVGQVVGVHVDEGYLEDGLLDTAAMEPIARCGYHDYAVVQATFTMVRPG